MWIRYVPFAGCADSNFFSNGCHREYEMVILLTGVNSPSIIDGSLNFFFTAELFMLSWRKVNGCVCTRSQHIVINGFIKMIKDELSPEVTNTLHCFDKITTQLFIMRALFDSQKFIRWEHKFTFFRKKRDSKECKVV